MATVGIGPYSAATAGEKNEPTRPLAYPSPSIHPATGDDIEVQDAAATTGKRRRSMQCLRRRRSVLCCGGCCVASVVIAGIVALVLALTVFKVKDPVFTMNDVTLEDVDGEFLGADDRHPVSVNATLNADISIKNPNVASFSYDRSETSFYYKGETVGVAYAPDGEVGAGRTVRMNVTLDALADRISPNVNVTDLIFGQGQDYDLTSYTEISGRVGVLGIYKRDLHIKVNCSITLEVSAFSSVQSKNTDCVANVK
uniref:Late embryogenesis abundant protein LEA-2 subgroup domain-containing protein n=2 Tax=Hordeum vulgare subsp. vulgare TaxID=112509 RepID=A0A8I6XNY9_HORVV